MVYGELGRYPLEIDIKIKIVSYWCKLLSAKETKLSSIAYRLLKTLFTVNNVCTFFVSIVKNIG